MSLQCCLIEIRCTAHEFCIIISARSHCKSISALLLHCCCTAHKIACTVNILHVCSLVTCCNWDAAQQLCTTILHKNCGSSLVHNCSVTSAPLFLPHCNISWCTLCVEALSSAAVSCTAQSCLLEALIQLCTICAHRCNTSVLHEPCQDQSYESCSILQPRLQFPTSTILQTSSDASQVSQQRHCQPAPSPQALQPSLTLPSQAYCTSKLSSAHCSSRCSWRGRRGGGEGQECPNNSH